MHPYLTERMLHQSEALAPLGAIAVQLRERLDGSGYPRAVSGAAITRPARLLGTADAYQAMREPRAHRPELSGDEAAAQLRADVTAGIRDPEAVDAVLAAAGHRVSRRRERSAGLTPREVEVLKLLAQGLSNKQIAQRLTISCARSAGTPTSSTSTPRSTPQQGSRQPLRGPARPAAGRTTRRRGLITKIGRIPDVPWRHGT